VARPPLLPGQEPSASGGRLPPGRSGTTVSISPRRFVRFLILCLLVGLALSFFGLDAIDVWRGAWSIVQGVYDTLVASIGKIGSYVLIGAAVIIPIWLLRAIWRRLGR
jgi:Family of unknown function (DUF6460)